MKITEDAFRPTVESVDVIECIRRSSELNPDDVDKLLAGVEEQATKARGTIEMQKFAANVGTGLYWLESTSGENYDLLPSFFKSAVHIAKLVDFFPFIMDSSCLSYTWLHVHSYRIFIEASGGAVDGDIPDDWRKLIRDTKSFPTFWFKRISDIVRDLLQGNQ